MTGLLEQYGYLAIVALVFVESFGVPAPGQTIIVSNTVKKAGRDTKAEW